jgi:hypothetical protein
MNPSIDKREHVLTIDGLVADPDIELAEATAGFYGIDDGRANAIVDRARAIVSKWKDRARKMRIAAGDIELTGSAFPVGDDRAGRGDNHALHPRDQACRGAAGRLWQGARMGHSVSV